MNAADKRNYLLRFHRFQKSREVYFAPKIFEAIRSQYNHVLHLLSIGYTEQQAINNIPSELISRVIKNLYYDAATIYGAKVRADLNRLVPHRLANPNSFNQFKWDNNGTIVLNKVASAGTPQFKSRLPMGFSEDMKRLIEQYFSLDILNESEGITETTKKLIREVFTNAYAKGEGIDDIISQLKDTELSRVRSRLIARTESVTASNAGALMVGKSTGLELNKEWLSASDNRVRRDHRHVNGQVVPIDGFFNVDGYDMSMPGDHGGKEGRLPVPVRLIANCRCCGLFLPVD